MMHKANGRAILLKCLSIAVIQRQKLVIINLWSSPFTIKAETACKTKMALLITNSLISNMRHVLAASCYVTEHS